MELEVEENLTGGTTLTLKLLPLTKLLQSKHGLRHGDYQRYRGYCSRRLARLRKVLKIVQGERKKFTKKDVTIELLEQAAAVSNEISNEAKHLQVPLMNAERAWAYAMQLKFEMNTDPRKKYHMVNRLRKAKVHSEALGKNKTHSFSPYRFNYQPFLICFRTTLLVVPSCGCKIQVGSSSLRSLDQRHSCI